MKKYRIIQHNCYNGKCFEVQKRFLGFLWWYNFNNIDGMTTGIYDTFEEAQEAGIKKALEIILENGE